MKLIRINRTSQALTLCAWCPAGKWQYLLAVSLNAIGWEITHGVCPECKAKALADLERMMPGPSVRPLPRCRQVAGGPI